MKINFLLLFLIISLNSFGLKTYSAVTTKCSDNIIDIGNEFYSTRWRRGNASLYHKHYSTISTVYIYINGNWQEYTGNTLNLNNYYPQPNLKVKFEKTSYFEKRREEK